jgi:outer membrane translocation and assembly module TamA
MFNHNLAKLYIDIKKRLQKKIAKRDYETAKVTKSKNGTKKLKPAFAGFSFYLNLN